MTEMNFYIILGALLVLIFVIRQLLHNEIYTAIDANIKHHEMNEHMYRRPLHDRGYRTTTTVSKDELFDMLLDYLDLEVVENTQLPCQLVKKPKPESEKE